MTIDSIPALMGFALVTSITPGPSNLILLASGLNFGFRRSLPPALGVSLGFLSMLFLTGLGLGRIFQAGTVAYMVLRILCLVYILYLAWKIARSRSTGEPGDNRADRPLSFYQAGLLQWVNPKAWAVALIVNVAYTAPGKGISGLMVPVLVFGAVNLPSISVWAGFGAFFKRLISNPKAVRIFNLAMALLLAASTIPLILNMV